MTAAYLAVLYASGWFFAIRKWFDFRRVEWVGLSRPDKIFLWVVFTVPLGKLIFFHVPGLIGFKFSFLFWSLFIALFFTKNLFDLKFRPREILLFLFLLIPPSLSLFARGDVEGLLVYSADGQSDSLLARWVSYVLLVLFMFYTVNFIKRKGVELVARLFIDGLLVASWIGLSIYVAVYIGAIGVDQLLPISADTHLIDNVYRFNPGSNVNEFGVLAAYGLFLLPLKQFDSKNGLLIARSLLLFALFFSLTRAAWVAFAFALLLSSLLVPAYRMKVVGMFLGFICVFVLVYSVSSDFAELVTSRIALDGGASGLERIEKFEAAYQEVIRSSWYILFGLGWATNLYMHSVPLQLMYEVGLLGTLCFLLFFVFVLLSFLIKFKRLDPKISVAVFGCMVVMLVASIFHHTLYHMQTWLVVGLFAGVALEKAGLVAQRSSPSQVTHGTA